MRETVAKFSKTKRWFYEKINKIDKPLVRLIKSIKLKMKKEQLQQTIQKYK